MKAGHILSAGLVSILAFGCNQASEPSPRAVEGRTIAPTVNSLSMAAATKAGFGVSRAAAEDLEYNPFDERTVNAMREVGICENFILLAEEIFSAGMRDTAFDWMSSPRFQEMVMCLSGEVQSWGQSQMQPSPAQAMAVIDKCLCAGSGTVFGAIGTYNFAKYSAPRLNGYSAPAIKGYSAPTTAPGYGAPSVAPGYSAPSL